MMSVSYCYASRDCTEKFYDITKRDRMSLGVECLVGLLACLKMLPAPKLEYCGMTLSALFKLADLRSRFSFFPTAFPP